MKTIYKNYKINKTGVSFSVSLVALFRAVGAEGVLTAGAVPAEVLDCLRLGVERPNVTGVVALKEGRGYVIDGDVLTVNATGLTVGINRVHVYNQYGTNLPEMLVVEVVVPDGAEAGVEEIEDELTLPSASSFVPDGGGADYKTDIYMDGAGRVIVERGEDGSTILMDEHENPILKRNADGSTEYYDAYQSARLLIGTDGAVSINDPTAGTLAIAEAIMARATKHLLSWAGEGNPIKEGDNVLTHADLYDMLMNTPAFVVLVYADHAYHPNLVTATQIAFTCSYASTNGDIVVERVTITSEDAVSSLRFSGVTRNSVDGVAIGSGCVASGNYSHAEGSGTSARSYASHAEGLNAKATGGQAHAEGSSSEANGFCSHAEGANTAANGSSSHAEGSHTIVTREGSHADGAYNNADDMEQASYAHGCGTSDTDRRNSVLYVGQEVYIFGIGGYDGTNHASEGVQSLRQVLSAINLKLINVPTA